jgi:hypothetical protein
MVALNVLVHGEDAYQWEMYNLPESVFRSCSAEQWLILTTIMEFGRPVSLQELTECLYPDDPSAMQKIDSQIQRIRLEILGARGWLQGKGSVYEWVPDKKERRIIRWFDEK